VTTVTVARSDTFADDLLEECMSDSLAALDASVDRLATLVGPLDLAQLTAPAYPSEWSIADTLSHLGSGAVIFHRLLGDALAGVETPADAAPEVLDVWNAKAPADQAADALRADRELIDRLEGLDDDARERVNFSFGPMTIDFARLVSMRLNEHALHTWDVEVALDPSATIGPEATEQVIDQLGLMAGYLGKATGSERTVHIVTSSPRRVIAVDLQADGVTLSYGGPVGEPVVDLPAEACIRLVYGRLDPEHAAGVASGADLDELRRAFPGA
jgi:uncharacterized protein (TIGR03083 family)